MDALKYLLVRKLVAGMALAGCTALAAQTATIESREHIALSISAQPLSDALIALGTQTGLNILSPSRALTGIRSTAVTGQFTASQALARMLVGTGLSSHFVNANTVNILAPSSAQAATASSTTGHSQADSEHAAAAKDLGKVTVLGSLIPRAQIETASPLIVITAQDIKDRGYNSVADVLQHSSVNTGATSNTSFGAGSLEAAKTISLFGLDSSYTKVLVDGRPMPNFSSPDSNSFTGSDQLVANLGSIPLDMVERIEILPGSQSSLYGSEAIAGVVNVVLKKNADFATLDTGFGWYADGGGVTRKISMSNSFHAGKLSLLLGAQFNNAQPIWNYQRTGRHLNDTQMLTASRHGHVVSLYGSLNGESYFLDPSRCAGLSQLWSGSVKYDSLACNTPRASSLYSTLTNTDSSSSVSARASYEISPRLQLYADLLDTYQKQGSLNDIVGAAELYDPNLQDVVHINRRFAPEELPAGRRFGARWYENTYSVTLGGSGHWDGAWSYDLGLTVSGESLDDRVLNLYSETGPQWYFKKVLGPRLGTYGEAPDTYDIHAPDYAQLYQAVTPDQFSAFSGAASLASATSDDRLRMQLTNGSLFSLPGGDAGLALVAEGGHESWKYQPALALQTGELGSWDLVNNGGRNRWAIAGEWNLPVWKMLTLDASARYDRYLSQSTFGHLTYSLGVEFRPAPALLIRGKYGTAFKAPSLLDEFERSRDFIVYGTDYTNCMRLGYASAGFVDDCPVRYSEGSMLQQHMTNAGLKPITSTAWSYGVVWSPTESLSASLDFQHLNIENEVYDQGTDRLLHQEALCHSGTMDPSSPTCVVALRQIIRGPAAAGSTLLGPITAVQLQKINLAKELNNSILASLQYIQSIGSYGQLTYQGSYTNVLNHQQRTFPGDPVLDLLREPIYSSEFKTRLNASISWKRGGWNTTLTMLRDGATPNEAATNSNGYSAPAAGKLPAWYTYNGAVTWSAMRGLTLSFVVNNLLNARPPYDRTHRNITLPYNFGNYGSFGRSYLLGAKYQFMPSH